MFPRIALPLALLLIPMLNPSPAGAAGSVRTTRVVHGLRIDLSVPRQSYPQNALVPVTASVRNVSSRPVRLKKACGYGYLWVEVSDESGQVLYPPAIPGAPPPQCPGSLPQVTMQPGAIRHRAVVVLLRGANVRAVVSLESSTIQGAAITEHVIQGTPPGVIPAESGPYEATIQPHGSVHGPLYAATYTNCYLGITNVLTTEPANRTGWMRLTGPLFRLAPDPCESDVYGTVSWQVVAGWLGQPAAIWQSPDD